MWTMSRQTVSRLLSPGILRTRLGTLSAQTRGCTALLESSSQASCIYDTRLNCTMLKSVPGHGRVCWLHTSSTTYSGKAKNTKRKLINPIHVNRKPIKVPSNVVSIHQNMTVAELANSLNKDTDHVFEVMLYIKKMNTSCYDEENSVIDNFDVIKDVVKKSGFRFEIKHKVTSTNSENKDVIAQPAPDPSVLIGRPPVVTIMGHVDHGKTTLLDYLRHSNIVDQEFGGITQHIGAFSVTLPSGESITFLDTPGHAAFTAMRSRGAKVTDIIVLVVAADDGVMQQTVESIQLAMAAEVPIIVAINKIDKPDTDIERTKQGLMAQGIVLEDMGGDIQAVPISALKGTNISELQEAIVTQAELMELKGDPVGLVEGRVLESTTDPGRGKLTTALIQRGTLKKGCFLVAGTAWAKVRAMFDDQGRPISEAFPSCAVEMLGWKDLPSAGEEIFQLESEQRVKEVLHWRKEQEMQKKMEEDLRVISTKREEHELVYQEMLHRKRELGYRKLRKRGPRQKEIPTSDQGPQLSVVIKGDVDGTMEAILDTLDSYDSAKCRLDLVHYGVGNITETDIELAESFNGVIYGFNVTVPDSVSKLARGKNVTVKLHKVIYKLFDDLLEELNKRLPMVPQEHVLGEANLLQMFSITDGKKKIPVAGCRCTKGVLNKQMKFKVVRGQETLYDGGISSMKHHKTEVDSVKTDVECGISFEDKTLQLRSGDVIVCYQLKQVPQSIDWNLGF